MGRRVEVPDFEAEAVLREKRHALNERDAARARVFEAYRKADQAKAEKTAPRASNGSRRLSCFRIPSPSLDSFRERHILRIQE